MGEVVAGGGYAGVLAANRLAGRPGLDVVLVNPRRDFVERIRLHERACGGDDAVVDLAAVLAPHVRLVVDAADRVDAGARRVLLRGGEPLPYDHLVLAVGSTGAAPAVPGASEHAYGLSGLEEADALRAALLAAAPDAPVVVVGGGPTGIETAAELAGPARAVTLVTGGVLGPYLHPRARQDLAQRLVRRGVVVLDGPGAVVTRVGPSDVVLADGRRLPSMVTVWTAGFGVPDLAARSGLSTLPDGRLLTDETLTSVDEDLVVGAGDAVAPSGLPYRMSCQAAGQLGLHAADTVLARVDGRPPRPARVVFVGQCLSLGRDDGLVQLARRDDAATSTFLRGRLAARVKELVCRSTVTQLAFEARRPGLVRMPALVAGTARAEAVGRSPRAAALS